MDNLDNKIKNLANEEILEIPKSIENKIEDTLNKLDSEIINSKNIDNENINNKIIDSKSADNKNKESKNTALNKRKNRSYIKVAGAIILVCALTISSTGAVEKIVNYFQHNKESRYISHEAAMEDMATKVDLSVKDTGIELYVESIAADDNQAVIFYTIKSDKKIKEYPKRQKLEYFLAPTLELQVNGEYVNRVGMGDSDSKIINENEIKGFQRINLSREDLPDKFEAKVSIYENIYGEEGKWEIPVTIDKSKSKKYAKNYKPNKTQTIRQEYTDQMTNEKIEFDHEITIDKVILSPLSSQIVISEKVNRVDGKKTEMSGGIPMLSGNFAIFDEKGNALTTINKGQLGINLYGVPITNVYEFEKNPKDIKGLELVLVDSGEPSEDDIIHLDKRDITEKNIEWQTTNYGKIITKDIKIEGREIKHTFTSEGYKWGDPAPCFYDENGKEINGIENRLFETINKDTGEITKAYEITDKKLKPEDIKKISMTKNEGLKLLKDKKIEIKLEK